MMDELLGEFDNLKISALSKSKTLNQYVTNVTIGPNASILDTSIDDSHVINSQARKNSTDKENACSPNYLSSAKAKRASIGKIITEIESQMKDEVECSIRSRINKIQNESKQIDAQLKSEWVKRQQIRIEQSNKQEELMLKVLEEHDRKSLQQLQMQYQKQAEERDKRNLELQMKERQRHQMRLLIESIQKQQLAFSLLYQDIIMFLKENYATIVNNDPVKQSAMSKRTLKLKSLLENMDKVKEKCKMGTVSNPDLEIVVAIVREATKLKETFLNLMTKEVEKPIPVIPQPVATSIPQQEKKLTNPPSVPTPDMTDSPQNQVTASNPPPSYPPPSYPQTPQQNPPQHPTQALTQNPQSFAPPSTQVLTQNPQTPSQKSSIAGIQSALSIVETFVSKNSLKMYSNLQQYLENYINSFSQLATDPRLKQFRFHCQKAVNIPLNAISAVNSQHMLDKYNRLSNLLRGNNVEAGGTMVLSSQHPQGIAFCTDLLAKKFVLQGDLLISSNPESAHCYAAVLVALWHDFPDFGKLVLAYFYKIVPYLVPFYPPKISGQSDQDYYISLGYNYVDGVVEKQDKFLKRMSGIMRLYSAVTISRLKRGQQGPHPHGLACAWRWLANVLNLEPRSDITATLLFEFLEVTGSSMYAAYGVQFHKVLTFINDVYLPKMQQIDSGGPVTRLEVLLQKIRKSGTIEPPRGRLPEGFW